MTREDPQHWTQRFDPLVARWFQDFVGTPTKVQREGWAPISKGDSALLLAPTGSGKTLAAFLYAIDRLMFGPAQARGRVLYISPLKALAVDVQKNLQTPIDGLERLAKEQGREVHRPSTAIRNGDTLPSDRQKQARKPPDIWITTPESLYLMLSSKVREHLYDVDTIIVDEIHTLAPNKRGVHLALSIERLARGRKDKKGQGELQRIALSATQRPLEEIAAILGGGRGEDEAWTPRPVAIIDAGSARHFDLRVELSLDQQLSQKAEAKKHNTKASEQVPKPGELVEEPKFPALAPEPSKPQEPRDASVWDTIYPKVLEEILSHNSTIVFVNSRRLAERMAEAINTLGQDSLCRAHHGSVAKDQRAEIEDSLKRGSLKALIATSSMELGVDMAAVDLVLQIETPPTVAAGIQRIGRAAHHVGGVPAGVIFPKFRADLLSSAAVVAAMKEGEVEPTRSPQQPLDVLAQHIVSMVCNKPWSVADLYDCVRQAYAFRRLSQAQFEGVLDLLDGRYPSREFRGLAARLNWDRVAGTLTGRKGAKMSVVANPGTIPDLGLYPVYLADGAESKKPVRVGELDEEMVLESQVRDVFVLGATSWEIAEIRDDRVLVHPAPGKPGKMPFWRGRALGRSFELGERVGELTRTLAKLPNAQAQDLLEQTHALSHEAAKVLVEYVQTQRQEARALPHDRCIVVETFRDQLSDWRVCILSPFGARVHMPWALALAQRWREELNLELETMWADDGLVFRFPSSQDDDPPVDDFFPSLDELDDLVLAGLSASSLFAAHFRENAGRSLLLPKRRPGKRTPLWMQRRKSRDLLAIASRYPRFPMLLETTRECFQDVFDMPALRKVLSAVHEQRIQVVHANTEHPSPFARAILYRYVANFLYDADAPLAERKAQVLQLDFELLRELLGETQWQSVIEPALLDEVGRELQKLKSPHGLTSPDGLEDLLRALGDLSEEELAVRCVDELQRSQLPTWLRELKERGRILCLRIGGEDRWVVASDAGLYRDLVSALLPAGLPKAFLSAVPDPFFEFLGRYAATRSDFSPSELVARYGVEASTWIQHCESFVGQKRWVAGDFRGDQKRRYCDRSVLDRVRRRSLHKARAEIEPVGSDRFIAFCREWHDLDRPASGPDAVLDALERLSGLAMPLSEWDWILAERIEDYEPMWLDLLCARGELVWLGAGAQTGAKGKVALYLREHLETLARPPQCVDHPLAKRIREHLSAQGASRLDDGPTQFQVFGPEFVDVILQMTAAGELINDTLAPLRSEQRPPRRRALHSRRGMAGLRGRRSDPRLSGRWTLREASSADKRTDTMNKRAWIEQLLERYGVLLKEHVQQESFPGGYRAAYAILQEMEDHGQVRRGHFVAGVQAMQFALSGVEARLRQDADASDRSQKGWMLSAIDPAQPYGAILPWPSSPAGLKRPLRREAGARVIFDQHSLLAYVPRTGNRLWTISPELDKDNTLQVLSEQLVQHGYDRLEEIDNQPAREHPLSPRLLDLGWQFHGKAIRYWDR